MYKKFHNHKLDQTCSCLNNNLDVLVQKEDKDEDFRRISFLTISKTFVDILHCQKGEMPTTTKVIKETSANQVNVLQAKWCILSDQIVLAIATYKGILIYDCDGQLLLFYHNLCKDGEEKSTVFCRGITTVQRKCICVGTGEGTVFVIKPSKNSFSISQKILNHKVAISSLSGIDHQSKSSAPVDFASADDNGLILTFNSLNKFSLVSKLSAKDKKKSPCTTLQLLSDGTVVAGYFDGKVRIFDSAESTILAQISAHSRPVTCMDSVSDAHSHMVISGSEDSYLRAWKIGRKDKSLVTQEWCSSVRDFRLCGLRFCGTKEKYFAVTGYDSHEIIQFVRVRLLA